MTDRPDHLPNRNRRSNGIRWGGDIGERIPVAKPHLNPTGLDAGLAIVREVTMRRLQPKNTEVRPTVFDGSGNLGFPDVIVDYVRELSDVERARMIASTLLNGSTGRLFSMYEATNVVDELSHTDPSRMSVLARATMTDFCAGILEPLGFEVTKKVEE